MVEKLNSTRFICEVHSVDIMRLKSGPDHVILKTNLPNPCYPYAGTMSLKFEVTRGNGPSFVRTTWPGIEFHVYDYEEEVRKRKKLSLPAIRPV